MEPQRLGKGTKVEEELGYNRQESREDTLGTEGIKARRSLGTVYRGI